MKTRWLTLLVAVIVLTLAACGNLSKNAPNSNAQPTPSGSMPPKIDALANARLNFGDNCALCHKVDGTGGPITIKGEKLKVPALNGGHALRRTDQAIEDQISDGGDGMPQFKDKLTKEQIHDLMLFIRKEFQGGGQPAT